MIESKGLNDRGVCSMEVLVTKVPRSDPGMAVAQALGKHIRSRERELSPKNGVGLE